MPKELWKPFPFDGLGYLYDISSFGRLRTTGLHRTPNIIITGAKKGGRSVKGRYYHQFHIHLDKLGINNCYRVHRVVATAFIPNPQHKSQVNHKDGKKDNNFVGNLEWATPKENGHHAMVVLHAYHHKCGGRHCLAKLTAKKVRWILKNRGKITMALMAVRVGVKPTTVSAIATGQNWHHIWKEYYGKNKKKEVQRTRRKFSL